MINLGLARIAALVASSSVSPGPLSTRWRAVHVAGTNGKGSVCAYLEAMLVAAGVKTGKFTSPHLVDRWDCIQLGGKPISKEDFEDVESTVKKRVKKRVKKGLEPTAFEMLTATAFEAFRRHEVDLGVVEVGLGGRLDATNVLENPLVTIITKIGLDHQAFLGNTLAEIAREKAGIIKPGAACVVDGSNDQEALDSIQEVAAAQGSPVTVVQTEDIDSLVSKDLRESLEPHQQMNLACAVAALDVFLQSYRPGVPVSSLIPAVQSVTYPGRLQMLDTQRLTGRSAPILLDGAHNPQSAEVLARYVERHLRNPENGDSVTWVLAFSKGKDISQILSTILRPQDRVVAVQFGSVDGMDWVAAEEAAVVQSAASSRGISSAVVAADTHDALRKASDMAGNGPLVVAGSLYLVSDVLKLLRNDYG